MKLKHRSNGVKREHGIVEGLLPLLERIASLPAVGAVIPGRIRVTKNHCPTLTVRLQARTVSGFKLGARVGTLAQEVFVVTARADEAEAALIALGLTQPR